VVVGAAQHDRAQHRVDRLAAVADETGDMPGAADDAGAAMAGISVEQLFEQLRAEAGHRGADRGFHHRQSLTVITSQRGCGEFGQAGYFGRERLLERAEEPPFSPSVPASGFLPPVSGTGGTGLASQIASFTATIFSVSSAKAW
jgi:hypothetical protein